MSIRSLRFARTCDWKPVRGSLDHPAPARWASGPDRGCTTRAEFEPREHISWLLKQAFHYTRRAADEAMRAHGVTSAQGGVLIRLAQRPGLSAADLARLMFITPQAAQQTLAALEGLGLVERSADPDNARILRAVLTARGLQVATGCRAEAVGLQNPGFGL